MCGERPLLVLGNIVRQSATLEITQYLMAVPGAVIVSDEPWALALFLGLAAGGAGLLAAGLRGASPQRR